MLVRIYAIVSLLLFSFLTFSGSGIEPSMLKSVIVFSVLVITTRISVFLIDIIKETSNTKSDHTPSTHQT